MKKNELKNELIKYGLNKIIDILKTVLHLKGIIEDLSEYVTNLVLIIKTSFSITKLEYYPQISLLNFITWVKSKS